MSEFLFLKSFKENSFTSWWYFITYFIDLTWQTSSLDKMALVPFFWSPHAHPTPSEYNYKSWKRWKGQPVEESERYKEEDEQIRGHRNEWAT